ncbi:hypothetical protein F1880_005685 [Penicillium rolfsii]|nr:hypothetical protein F1880_005685 [Penicillium rolfsii]
MPSSRFTIALMSLPAARRFASGRLSSSNAPKSSSPPRPSSAPHNDRSQFKILPILAIIAIGSVPHWKGNTETIQLGGPAASTASAPPPTPKLSPHRRPPKQSTALLSSFLNSSKITL